MLIVHGGFHKTGSTALQSCLRAGALHGVRYLPEGYQHLAAESLDPGFVEEAVAASRRAPAVVSSEATFGAMTDMYAAAGSRASNLADALGDAEYRIVVFVRPLISWLESAYVQLVQQGESVDAVGFLEGFGDLESLGWVSVLGELDSAFGADRLVVLPHTGKNDVVQRFAEALELEPPPEELRLANRSIPASEASVMALVNARLDRRQARYLRTALQNPAVQRSQVLRTSPFDAPTQAKLLERSKIDWSDLRQRWGGGSFAGAMQIPAKDRPLPTAGFSQLESFMAAAISDVLTAVVVKAERQHRASVGLLLRRVHARVRGIPVIGTAVAKSLEVVRRVRSAVASGRLRAKSVAAS